MRDSVDSSTSELPPSQLIQKLQKQLTELDRNNAKIKKQIQKFPQLEVSERQAARELL